MSVYCKINGVQWDNRVAISDIEESLNVLDGDNSGRVMTGRMVRDVIGAYIGHKVTFFNGKSQEEFDALWDFLKKHSVDDHVKVEICDNQSSIKYDAYYTKLSRKLISAGDDGNYWDEIQVSFVAMDAQVRP